MTAVLPPSEFAAAPDAPLGPSTAHVLASFDGTPLAFRVWLPQGGETVRQALLLIHRGHEHSGRFEDVVPGLALPGTAIFAWDQRGHGDSPGERGYAESLSQVVRDLDFWARHVCAVHGLGLEQVVAVGHSIGAVTLAAWVHDYAPPIRAMVLVAPAFSVKLYVPLAVPGLRFLQKVRGGGGGKKTFIKSYVKARMLTHDAAQAAAYDADPKIARSIAVNMLLDLHDTSARLVADAATIQVPTLVLNAGADWVVKPAVAARFFARLSSPVKRLQTFAGMYHDLLHERERGEVLAEIRGFAKAAFAREHPANAGIEAQEATVAEHARLSRRLGWWSPRGWSFALQRISMKTLGRLSEGMRLGWRTGFNSGATLDYVYENTARGALGLGKMLDRTYLDAIGWRGIRIRRGHVQELVRVAAEMLRAEGQEVRVVDVAAGPGRYLLEMAAELQEKYGAEMLLRDADATALARGRALAERLGLQGVRFEVGDAFDEAGLAEMMPGPSVAVISGLFELFPENERVMRTLRGLAAALRRRGGAGGYLVYTGQPWHPQLEMIARVLVGFDGKPWAMRRRSQWELDGLVRAAGFEKIEQRIDTFGIFTVSLAKVRGWKQEHPDDGR